jgi:DNA polymerase III sliding clamp (beta) subunit (PCNA family)
MTKEGSTVKAGNTILNTLSSTFYAGFSKQDVTQALTVNSELLKMAFAKTHYLANGENNMLFDGVHLRSGVALSTDQKSISAFKLPIKLDKPITLPKQVTGLLNIFQQENILIEITDSLVCFSGKAGSLSSKLLDGDYPDVMKFIQPVSEYSEAPRDSFLQVLKKCQAVQSAESDPSHTLLSFNGKELQIDARGTIGRVQEVIPLTKELEGTHNFSTKALLSILSNLRSSDVRIFLDKLLYLSDSSEEVVLLLPVRTL